MLAGNEALLKRPGTKALWTSEDLSQAWLGFHSVAHNAPSDASLQGPLNVRGKTQEPDRNHDDSGRGSDSSRPVRLGNGFGLAATEFYQALQKNLTSGAISDRNGVLAAVF